MFFQVTREGRPLRKRRYAYSESFAAIAYAAHARATGKRALGQRGHANCSTILPAGISRRD